MIGRIVTALAGSALARTVGGVAAGPAGAVIGMALPLVARRLGPMGMVAMAVGAWAVGRVVAARRDEAIAPAPLPAPGITSPPIAMTGVDT